MNKVNKYIAVSTLALSQAIIGCTNNLKASNLVNSNSKNVDYILNNKSDTTNNNVDKNYANYLNYTSSINYVGKNEINNFYDFFGIYDENVNDFVEKVKLIQKQNGLNIDGILGPNTLRVIYLNYYINSIDRLNIEARKRLEIYMTMKGYKNVDGAYYNKLNVFSKNTYYGNNVGTNIVGTYINENLVNHFEQQLSNRENKIVFDNINGKTALAFYVNGVLEVATYVTPGINNHKYSTPKLVTKGKKNPDKLHISSQYPEIKDEYGNVVDSGGAVMPFAVHVENGVWLHGSDSKIDGLAHSHGCVRVGLYYIEHIYQLVKQLGVSNVIMDTRNIY